ncbi:amidohydrolase [uncultured Dubosiella sp.]|uniref:amidohydrolase n=1 Tax=uncultured Dubosiella sp. TaxID=1937011 RepID=UPI00259A44AE|nr:amidohydrolase [uncultured Dubosiella sp.]
MLFKNAHVFPVETDPFVGDVRVTGKKIAGIGVDLQPVQGEEVVDCTGFRLYPGMVEAHCHLGMEESSIRSEGDDVNEMSDPLTPQVRGIDGCYPRDESVANARKAGVTCVAAGPGSANVVGGTFVCYKTFGDCIDDMAIVENVAMKAAFGENPKRVYQDSKIKTRMNIAALLRNLLFKTREYMEKKAAGNDVPFNIQYEAMIPVLEKKMPLKCHAHRSDDILTVIRIAKEFDLVVTLDHVTDGAVIVDQIKKSGYPCIVGPSLTHKSKYELQSKSFKTPKVIHDAGILFSITTDSPVVPQEYLPLCAALAHKEGLPEAACIEAITLSPAKILKIDDRVGSIRIGKDADLILCSASLLDPQNEIKAVFIDGQKVA